MELSHRPEKSDSALDSLEHELYNPKAKIGEEVTHSVRSERSIELPTSWGDSSPIITQGKEEGGFSFGAKAFIASLVMLLVAVSIVAFRVISLRNVVSSANIDMSLDVSPYVEGGESLPVTFTLHNKNTSALMDAAITLEYKKGAGSQDEQEKIYEKRVLGVINPNENKRQDFDNVYLYGQEAETRDLTIKLEYKVVGSNAVFSKVVTSQTILKTPQVSVKVEGPKDLSLQQNATYAFTVKNNSATTSLPSVLQITLPNTFTVADVSRKAVVKGNIWAIKSLKQGETDTIKITGSVSGTQGETVSIKALVGQEGGTRSSVGVVYSTSVFDIMMRSSPLNFAVSLDAESGQSEKIRYGDRAVLTIAYANTSNKTLNDVSIKMAIEGDAAIIKTVDPLDGDYDSIAKTILWNSANVPALTSLPPGGSGSFRVIIPIVTSGSNSPKLKIALTGEATMSSRNDVVSTVSKTWSVEGMATLGAKTTYTSSPFPNTGPVPPVANKETTYTVRLLVSAQNALSNTKVSFILPSYVTWRGVASDISKVSYDNRSRTVTWAPGSLAPESSALIDIGLSVKPSQSHVGHSPSITSGIVLDTDEEVSRAHIRTTLSPLTTYISGENLQEGSSIVVDN